MSDTIIQGALIANAAGMWKAGKGSCDCTFETSALAGYEKRAFRITTVVKPCSIPALQMLFATPGNTKLYEPAIEEETIIEECDSTKSALVHTRFGPQGIVQSRDFLTRQGCRVLPASHSTVVEKLAAQCSADSVFVFASKSEEDHRMPSFHNIVRGEVQLHAFIGVPIDDGSESVKLTYLSSVDPRGSIPNFALEASWPENCNKVAKVRELLVLIQNLMTNAKRAGTLSLLVGSPSLLPTDASCPNNSHHVDPVVVSVQADGSQRKDSVGPRSNDAARDQPSVAKEVVIVEREVSPEPAHPVAAVEDAPPPTTAATKPLIERIVQLWRSPEWVAAKTLDNCLLEEMASPFPTPLKLLRISTTASCSLGTFVEFMEDISQVRKYDPQLDKLDIVKETDAGVVIYSSYKQQTRLVAPRDFCSLTAKTVLHRDEAIAFGFPASCLAAYIQASVNAADVPPQKDLTRGIIHIFGYIALAEGSDAQSLGLDGTLPGSNPNRGSGTIKIYNIACVDPCGKIPGWLIEAANAESCKKLAAIRKLVSERQVARPGAVPRRLSMARRSASSAALVPARRSAQPSESRDQLSESTTSSADFRSCIDENEVLQEAENLKSFYDRETDEVVHTLVLLHTAKAWEHIKTNTDDIKLETLSTPICDKKAVRVSCEFKCNLETFRTMISTLDHVRKYDPGLDELECLDSPPYGTVIYTSYKSGSKIIQPRDFCTLTCGKQLGEEEGADAGLYTKGFRASAFVVSSVNSNDKPPQQGFVRGTVHAHGFIAVAVPPDAPRIRVYHIALVDPMGSIPAKLVDAAMADAVKKVDTIRHICCSLVKPVGSAGASPTAAAPAATPLPLAESAFPPVDEIPILRKLCRVHTSSSWEDPRYVGKFQTAWAHCDMDPQVPVLKLSTEMMCSIDAFVRVVTSSDFIRRSESDSVDVVKFLDGPPNATIGYVSYRPSSKVFASHDKLTLTVNRVLSEEEGAELGLYTKTITSAAFAMSSVHWSRGVPEQAGMHRLTVYYDGFIAVATPPNAGRIRVFHYVSYGGAPSILAKGSKFKDAFVVEMVNRLTRANALCEQAQSEMDASLKPVDVPTEPDAEPRAAVREADTTTTPHTETACPETEAAPTVLSSVSPVADNAPDKSCALLTRPQLGTLSRLIDLHRRKDWEMGKVIERCLLETAAVDYCGKKAIRISTDFQCSLATLEAFLADVNVVRVMDPALDKFEVVGEIDSGVAIYTSYTQQTRFVAPRDFYTTTFRKLLNADAVEANSSAVSSLAPPGHCILLQNSRSLTGGRSSTGNLVRGFVHVHGFLASAPSASHVGIKVFNVSCVDPSGSIPNWILEAVNAEACKKMALMRKLCEERQQKK